MSSNIYGYARVSSEEQHEDRQIIALMKAGVEKERIFVDRQSGKDFNRPMYKKMVKKAASGDLIYIKSIDRLGRNYEEILAQWRYLTKSKNVDVAILDMPLLDTRRGKDLVGTFLSDVVLQLLSFVAENERNMIRQRQAEGIRAAKLRGVQFGRPKVKVSEDFIRLYGQWKDKKITAAEAAEISNIAISTFYYRAKKYAHSISSNNNHTG
jgi:DNA invertase Pin-like site-specific DNA recombinase